MAQNFERFEQGRLQRPGLPGRFCEYYTEEPPLLRDWAALLIWLGGAAILLLMHVSDLVELLFRR